jgi:hypothetical protein
LPIIGSEALPSDQLVGIRRPIVQARPRSIFDVGDNGALPHDPATSSHRTPVATKEAFMSDLSHVETSRRSIADGLTLRHARTTPPSVTETPVSFKLARTLLICRSGR